MFNRICSNNTNKLSPQEREHWYLFAFFVQIIQINLVLKNSLTNPLNSFVVQIIQINLVLKNQRNNLLIAFVVQIIQINLVLKNPPEKEI